MNDSSEQKHRTQTLPDRGSGGWPPRPTAVGTSGSGDDNEFHLGQTLACLVIGTFPGGYLVELESGRLVRGSSGEMFFIHAVFMSDRKMNIGDRTIGKLVQIAGHQFVLEDSILGTTRVNQPATTADPTLPTSSTSPFSRALPVHLSENKFINNPTPHEFEQVPEAKPRSVTSTFLPPPTVKDPDVPLRPVRLLEGWRLDLDENPALLFKPFDKHGESFPCASTETWTSRVDKLESEQFCGIIRLASRSFSIESLFLNGQFKAMIKEREVFFVMPFERVRQISSAFIKSGESCTLEYFSIPPMMCLAAVGLITKSSQGHEKTFPSLIELINYHMTKIVWNKNSAVLALTSGKKLLLMIWANGEFIAVWDYFETELRSDLACVFNFVAQYPNAEAALIGLENLDL